MFRNKKEDRLCIKGENGAGKSTLLNIISGEISPKYGNIRGNKDILIDYSKHLPLYKRGYIFDYFKDKLLDRVIGVLELFDINEEILIDHWIH
ncbi:ATP-binding cassette domain-containing protein [Tissierella sp. MSJ-40]|uniref:ATP-binding cassette domain-containing protein n=1 Tax=Tissierella simiarum TaxID=2841534 RepID=A0ABS6E9X5_9FIRM|nr:ATP-binding cassette domain-containing protein [Tissierella simiarum]